MSSFARPFLEWISAGLTWERLVMMLMVLVPFVVWHQDELYVWGWTAVAAMLVLRLMSKQVSLQWVGLAIGLVAVASMGHPWNRHALLYLGAALAMTLTPKRNEIARQATSMDVWIATGLYGVGIWGGWLFEWSSPGFTELHCATWLLLLLHAASKCTSGWKPWVGIFAHGGTCVAMSAWAPAIGLVLLVAWWVWGRHWSLRCSRGLVGVCLGCLLLLTVSSPKWPAEVLPASLQERATLWTWTLSEDFGAIHGPGQWRLGIAEADLFEGARQPRRAHNIWLEWGHDLGWLGWGVLLMFAMLHPWLALITSPLFFLWFPTERPDFMLLMALLTSQGMLRRRSEREVAWVRIGSAAWTRAIASVLGVVWMLAVAMSMHSIRAQKAIERHARMHWTLTQISSMDRLALTWFPDGVRGKSDGWVKLMQHALKEGEPCEAVEWADKRRERGFPDQKSLEAKARTGCK
ncbi:MAG: hypothetical protein ACPF87_02200 [Flavobacteriales bacterium]